jgi:hypothetical protein
MLGLRAQLGAGLNRVRTLFVFHSSRVVPSSSRAVGGGCMSVCWGVRNWVWRG